MGLPTFSPLEEARLVHSVAAAAEQAWVQIEPPPGWNAEHVAAGQFCKMRIDGKEGIFAMYSAPGELGAEFLVRVGNPDGGEAADALVALPDGARVAISRPAGRGFDLRAARGCDLHFVATGTGIAPVRAAIETVLADRASYGELSLDHGVRTEAHLAVGSALDRWRSLGIDVRIAYSRIAEDGRLIGSTVQASLRQRTMRVDRAYVLAVGQSTMLEELVTIVGERGADATRVLTNL
ncbi:MAG: hypothetical protein AB7S26_12360 [Sandaracinaceae bacterium]